MRFLARSLIERGDFQGAARERQADPASHPVSTMVRGEALICPPATSVRDAAQMMSARSKTSIVVDIGDGTLGIVTDSDLRRRVLAQGLGGDTPVSVAMSAPAYTCTPDQLGGDVLLDMLHRGFRHLPVVSVTGEILGVVKDQDIAVMDTRSSTFLRKRIARAQSVEELVAAAAELRPSIVVDARRGRRGPQDPGDPLDRRRRADAQAGGAGCGPAAAGAVRVAGARQPRTSRAGPELGSRQRDRVVR